MKRSKFVHLHNHTMYSTLDGYGSPEQYVKRAVELNFTHLAITDHGGVDGVIKFQKACLAEGIKPIIGCEAYIVPDYMVKEKEKRYHITLLVKNKTGWTNLLKMLTQANLNGFYYRPRIDPSLLLDFCDGLIVMTACSSSVLWMPGGVDLIKEVSKKTEVLGEIMPLQLEEQLETNALVIDAALDAGFNIVATNDCHYPLAKQSRLQEVLLAMQTKAKWSNPKRWRFGIDDLYLKTSIEMSESFERQGVVPREIYMEAIENTAHVAELCNFTIEQQQPNLPSVYVPKYKGSGEDDQLINLAMDGLLEKAQKHNLIAENYDKYLERIEEEFSHIIPQFTRYFLVVWELINWCKNNNIMTGGRGCFTPGNKILYFGGENKYIEDVSVGDIILNHLGEGDIVINKFEYNVIEKIAIITTSSGKKISCTLDHKILTSKGWIKAKDLEAGDEVRTVKNTWTEKKAKSKTYKKELPSNRQPNPVEADCEETNQLRVCKEGWHSIRPIHCGVRLQNMQAARGGALCLYKKQKEWPCMGTNMQKLYTERSSEHSSSEKTELRSTAYSTKQARTEAEEQPRSDTCTLQRSKTKREKSKRWKKYTCLETEKVCGKAFEETSRRPELCSEICSEGICIREGCWNLFQLIAGTILYSALSEEKDENRTSAIQDKICERTLLLSRLPSFRQSCERGERVPQGITYSERESRGSNSLPSRNREDIRDNTQRRFRKDESNPSRLELPKLTGTNSIKQQGIKELVQEVQIQDYNGRVFDLQVLKEKSYNIDGIAVHNSSAGSLVSYCLGITRLDPIKNKLIFSRFISPGRIDLPDIDMDFEDRRRDEVKQHLSDTYGKWNVIEVSTFLKMHGRGALRDVGRVFDIPLYEVDKAAKCIVVRSGGDARAEFTIEDAFATFEDGIKFKEKYPEVTETAMAFEGQIKSGGRHAAACCVSKDDLRNGENANIVLRNNTKVCNWEKEDAEHMGLMKLDVLGLNALTILSETKKLIKERKNIDIEYELIDLEDPKIYEQFTEGNSTGVFQFGSPSMVKLCRDIHGENFDQVTALNALHRPGALRSGYTQIYRDRKFGTKETTYPHPWIEGITKDTYGLIIYQEQVMRLMYELGGLPWKTADTIRKVISKSKGVEAFMEFEDQFIEGCKRLKTLSKEDAKTIFGELKNTGSYSFNKSHAAEYSLTAVWEMYLKVYYPVEFMATLLSYGPAGKKSELINEAKRLGIKILLPDINLSDSNIWKIDEYDNLLAPFREIKGIGEVASKEIVDCRGVAGDYKDLEDLESKVKKNKVNKKVRGLLVASKAFLASKDKLNLPEEELEELSKLFDFELSNDPLYRYRNIIKKIGDVIGLKGLKESYKLKDKFAYYFGRMESLRVGYRAAIGEKTGKDSFGSLGGVYGNLKDDTDFKMLIFGTKIYLEKKDIIEHCEGQAVLTYANNSDDNAALKTQAVWFGDELISGDIEGVRPGLGVFGDNGGDRFEELGDLTNCVNCELRDECLAPVYPTCGNLNVMIVGEAPGREENLNKRGFVGAAGKILFRDLLSPRGIERELFHITNICKCWPSRTKTPKKKHVDICGNYLIKEIEDVKPFLILSLGNIGNLFFRGEASGITAINGQTIWNDRFNCWVTYSVHPAMAAYDSANMPLLDKSINEFVKKIKILM